MRLSILDQSPILRGHDARRAIEETLALARRADELGYCRYWLAEHHAIAALADPCPEMLVARLGAETKKLRIGTGGVLLPYYSAFRTAESFRMLEALYPGRIDLGIGRAPGGDARTAHAVSGAGFPDAARFPEQVQQLVAHLDGTLPAGHPFHGVRVQPEVQTRPEVWLLGSSDYSGVLAAELGLPFSFAHFINPRGGEALAQYYRARFKPGREAKPRVVVCTFAICAESDAEAERLAAPIDLRRLHMALNIDSPIPSDEEAAQHRYSEEERTYVMAQRARAVLGSPATCRREIEAMAARYGADEMMVLTITGSYETRRRSYELLMDAFTN